MKKAMNQSLITLILNGISILTLIFMVVSLISDGKVRSQLNNANEARYELSYNANRFMNGSAYLTNEVRAFAATGDTLHYDNYFNEINNLKNRDLGVAAMQEIGITTEEQALIDEMYEISNSLVPLEEEAMKMVQAGNKDEALDYVYGKEYSEAISKINSIKEQFLTMQNERTLSRVNELIAQADRIEFTMELAFALVGVIQLISMFTTRLRVLRPVIKVKNQMGEIAKGNLSADFNLQSDTSEIGMLVNSIHETKRELKVYIKDIEQKLEEMAHGNMNLTIDKDYLGEFLPIRNAMAQILDALNHALSKISATSELVSEESRHVASAARSLSNGVVDQASAVERLSSGIQEISEQVDNTSRDAEVSKKSSVDMMHQLEICDEKMEQLTTAIDDISDSSNQIFGIIKTIEDISLQTKILALNAAVEAARAGEAGKGFAVVAGEVQNLANISSDSAQNISELIENSMQLVSYGATLSVEAKEALASLVTSAKIANERTEQIADSAIQQSDSIKQIKIGMEQISDVVQTNAATAEKSSASANELYNQAEELKLAVQQFQLRR